MEEIAEGLAEERLRADHELVDFFAQRNATDGNGVFGRFGKSEIQELAFVKPVDVSDLVDVMILGGHPEDRDGGNALLREFVRGLYGAEGFVEREGGAAEQANLLAADHGDGAFGEVFEILQSFGAAAEEFVLCAENGGDPDAAVGGKFQFFGVAGNGFELWGVFEEGFKAGVPRAVG